MKKKTLVFLSILAFTLFFSVSYCFANNNIAEDAVNGVRNVVGGAENAVEGTVSGVTNGVRNGINDTENAANNIVNGTMKTTNNEGDYTAARTATTRSATGTNNNTFLGMGATAWGWLIMAVLGVITVALVWFYGKEREAHSNYDDNNY